MKDKKIDTVMYYELGFPIQLINVPMKKILGEWVIDIDLNVLQKAVLYRLATKTTPLEGNELRFIIDYFEMSTREFAKLFSVTHPAILKWESGTTKMNPNTDICIKLYILDRLNVNDKEFRKIYHTFNQRLVNQKVEHLPIEIDAEKIAC